MSSTDVLIYVDVISNKQSIFFSQIRTRSFPINWPSLISTARSPVIFWRDSDLINLRTNTIQISICPNKAFAICDHKSDQTRSATHVNKTYLVWLMYWLLFTQYYQHRTNHKLKLYLFKQFISKLKNWPLYPNFIPFTPLLPHLFIYSVSFSKIRFVYI